MLAYSIFLFLIIEQLWLYVFFFCTCRHTQSSVWFSTFNPVIFIFVLHVDEVCGEDDQEDTEYNFMAEDQKEEKEEYRNDRAVRIPRE